TSRRRAAVAPGVWVAAAPGKGRPPRLSRALGSWSTCCAPPLLRAAGQQVALEAMPLHEPVERRAVDLCEPRRFREVAARPHHDARQVAPVEPGQQAVAGGVIARLVALRLLVRQLLRIGPRGLDEGNVLGTHFR